MVPGHLQSHQVRPPCGALQLRGSELGGLWAEGLLERFSGGTGALLSAWAQVSGMSKSESISLVILLHAESGAGRGRIGVGLGLSMGPDWLQ